MKTVLHLLAVSLLAGAAAFAGAAAQTAEQDLDLEAIRARAAQETGEAEALAASARARAEQLAREAKTSAAEAQTHGRRFASEAPKSVRPDPAQTFDFDAMVADAGAMTEEGMGEAPRFVAFASTSMPPAAQVGGGVFGNLPDPTELGRQAAQMIQRNTVSGLQQRLSAPIPANGCGFTNAGAGERPPGKVRSGFHWRRDH